jgi:hypothetical protein
MTKLDPERSEYIWLKNVKIPVAVLAARHVCKINQDLGK